MCGDLSVYGGEGDAEMLPSDTVRARKPHVCVVCGGPIPVGAYHCRQPYTQDGTVDSMRLHLQCRDLSDEVEYIGEGLLDDVADHEDRGPEWAAHHRAVAVWASGGEYVREVEG